MSSKETFIIMPKRRYDDGVNPPNHLTPNPADSDLTGLPSINARCSAFLLDYILMLFPLAITLVLSFYVKRRLLEPVVADFFQYVGYALVLVVALTNWIYGYVRFGQSFGKRFIGLRVVRVDGQPVDYKTAIIRLLGSFVSLLFFGLGFFWMLWDDQQRGWHDKLAKTLVIQD